MWLLFQKHKDCGKLEIIYSGAFAEVMEVMEAYLKDPKNIGYLYSAGKVEMAHGWRSVN